MIKNLANKNPFEISARFMFVTVLQNKWNKKRQKKSLTGISYDLGLNRI